jgi:hypothetical protein
VTQAVAIEAEINALPIELQQVQIQIHQASPRYAALTQAQPLTPAEIRPREAEQILPLAPASAGMKARDFEANRATAMSEHLSRYCITGRRSRRKANGYEFERQTRSPNDHNKIRIKIMKREITIILPQSRSPNPQSAIIEWYRNTAAGLEQGFTIESAPGERRDGERLRVALALEGKLTAEVVEGGKALELETMRGGGRCGTTTWW